MDRREPQCLTFIDNSPIRPPDIGIRTEWIYLLMNKMYSDVFSNSFDVVLKPVRLSKNFQTGVFSKFPIKKGQLIGGLRRL